MLQKITVKIPDIKNKNKINEEVRRAKYYSVHLTGEKRYKIKLLWAYQKAYKRQERRIDVSRTTEKPNSERTKRAG